MAWQACRSDDCSGGFNYDTSEMKINAERACTVCEGIHIFDGFRWEIPDDDTVSQ